MLERTWRVGIAVKLRGTRAAELPRKARYQCMTAFAIALSVATISATCGTVVVTPPVAILHDYEGPGAVSLFGVGGYLVCNQAPLTDAC
jgi:hypothetical protein